MKHLLTLLLFISTSVMGNNKFQDKPSDGYYLANVGIGGNDLNSDSTWWVHKDSVLRIDKKRRAWIIANYKENETLLGMSGAIKFKSEKMYVEFDCKDQYKNLHNSYYSNWGAKKDDQVFIDEPLDKYYLIEPESSLFTISKQLCSYD